MPYFAVPRYLRVMDHLPKTPTERVRKVELREAGITADTFDRLARMSDLDLGEAADYILSERPGLDEDVVWAVLNELGAPPAKAQRKIALQLLAGARPDVRARDARRILDEWRAYADLAAGPDWDDDGGGPPAAGLSSDEGRRGSCTAPMRAKPRRSEDRRRTGAPPR